VVDRPLILAGRPARPDHAHEVMANEAMAAKLGLEGGDRMTFSSWRPDQAPAL
jgi:anaerobic selenocysteine-containing dehydrogenase